MVDEPAPVDPQVAAADAVIQDFRTAHNDALLDAGHPEHARWTADLKGLYERRYSAEPVPQYDAVQGQVKPEDAVDEAADVAMRPLSADQFDIGAESDFGLSVDKNTYGWDSALETQARQTFAAAALNGAQARTVATSYYEALTPAFNIDVATRQSNEMLRNQYGEEGAQRAVRGTNAMLRQLAGQQMYSYIARSGIGSHPRFVGECVRVARQRGWWK
jgi:hypothetical protein